MDIAPLPENEAARLSELQCYQIIDTSSEEAFDDLTALASQICETPIALVSLIDAHRQWFKAKVGIKAEETSRDIAFCAHAILQPDLLIVPDASQDPRFADNPLVTSDPRIRFYAGVPLITSQGHALGTLCVIDRVPRQLTTAQQEALRRLGRQVVKLLEHRLYDRVHHGLEAELREREARLQDFLENASDLIQSATLEGRLLFANRAWRETLEYQEEEIPHLHLWNIIHPDSRPHCERILQDLGQSAGPVTIETTFVTKSGRPVLVEGSVNCRVEAGRPVSTRAIFRDITEAKKVEAQLKESATRYRTLFESSQDAIMTLAPPAWKFTSGNPATLRMFGAANEAEFVSLAPWEFSPEQQPDGQRSADKAQEMIALAMQKGSHRFEWTHQRLTGEMFPAVVLLTRLQLGEHLQLQATVRDVTEEKRAEKALRESEVKYKQLVENANDILYSTDATGHFTFISSSVERFMGYPPEDLLGQRFTILVRDDHRKKVERFYNRQFFRKIPNTYLEFPVLRRDGGERWVGQQVTLLQSKEQVVGFHAIVRDITDRKRAEEALQASTTFLQAILDNAGHAIISTTPDGLIQVFNPAAETLLGYSAEEMVGKQTPAVFHDPEEIRARARLFSNELGIVLTPGFDVFVAKSRRHLPNEHEWTYIKKDGARIAVLLNVTALRNTTGQIAGFLGIASDITDQKRIEHELLIAKNAAESANLAKSQFMAHMSHEIRTPMNGVIGMTELMLATPLTDRQRHLANTVHQSATALLDIINDILDWSKIEAGKLHLDRIDFDLSGLCEDIAMFFGEAAKRKGLTLTWHIAASVPPHMQGDPVRLRQILVNLLSNAIKFTEHGTIELQVDLVETNSGDALLRFSVKDSGIGIPQEAQQEIFKAFQQADSSTTRKYGGTGLGLAIVNQLVELMGGMIGVESAPGEGALFWFVIRLAHSTGSLQAFDARPALAIHRSDKTSNATRLSARILLAEDNAVNREVAVGMLEYLGCRVHAVENGRLALDTLRREPVDLVLMDCQMPDMDGFEATREIRRREESLGTRIPIVALTAHALQGDRELCLVLGMDDYLSKPFTIEQLRDILQRWLPASTSPQNNAAPPQATPPSLPTTPPQTDQSPVDPSTWESILNLQRPGHPDLLAKIIDLYLKDSAKLVDKIVAAVETGDLLSLQDAAHSLKSRSATLGAWQVAEICKQLEQGARTQDMQNAGTLAARLPRVFSTTCEIFHAELLKRAA